MSILSRFRRSPQINSIAAAPVVHAEESDPLMDQVAQVCAFDLSGFTVVRPEAEAVWVAETVAAAIESLDEWTPDVFDHEINHRHRIRLALIESQRQARLQEASRATAETEATLARVAAKVAQLRLRARELQHEVEEWTAVLTGTKATFEPLATTDVTPLPVPAPAATALAGPVIVPPLPEVAEAWPSSSATSSSASTDADETPEPSLPSGGDAPGASPFGSSSAA